MPVRRLANWSWHSTPPFLVTIPMLLVTTIGDQDRPLYWFLLNTSANIPLSKYKNWRTGEWSTPDTYYNGYYENPYWAVGTNRDIDDSRRLMANVAVSYDILPWMKLTARVAMNNTWGIGRTGVLSRNMLLTAQVILTFLHLLKTQSTRIKIITWMPYWLLNVM